MSITFIGGGNMASALIGGLLQRGWNAAAMHVVEIAPEARERLVREFGVKTVPAIDDESAAAECIVLAVKPQQLRDVARTLGPRLATQLVISIAAGMRVADIARWLGGYQKLVRVMPNTPALVRAGISALYATPAVSASDRAQAETIMSAVGTAFWLASEHEIDAVTAISGSGPAYVFYFIEALQRAALELGFDAATARRLALETFAGAVRLAQHAGEEAAVLRSRVTSRGGTTERALSVMEAAALPATIVRAARAAADRSRELGDELGKD